MLVKKIKNKIKFLKKFKKNVFFFIKYKILVKKLMNIVNKKKKSKKEKIYIEIRSSIGGNESCMFVKDIFKMYKKYLENNKMYYEIFYKKKIFNGLKRIIIRTEGKNIFKKFYLENGVHRIQRIPINDKKKRIHTSTCIVEVYKEEKEDKINLKRKELKIDTFKASGSGGQHVNKTNSAIRITHLPTGIKVECQKERSQIENRRFAIKLLISKIKKKENEEKNYYELNKRKENLFSYSKRSGKIRTYNFIRNCVTDHYLKKNFSLKKIYYEGKLNYIFKKYNL
ncbi:peptide chain release factor-like protein [Candidatus Vidania fulgoroideorum]